MLASADTDPTNAPGLYAKNLCPARAKAEDYLKSEWVQELPFPNQNSGVWLGKTRGKGKRGPLPGLCSVSLQSRLKLYILELQLLEHSLKSTSMKVATEFHDINMSSRLSL